MKNRSVMKHQFSQVPSVELQRSSFDRSHALKTTFDAGLLIPILVDEALPGDTFNLDMTGFARLATPIFPIMDNMFMETFFFAVPNRLLWDNWEKFNGAQDDPGDSVDFLIPQTTPGGGGYPGGTIHDYLGLPTGIGNITNSVLFHRAYNLIFSEWFRDQNLTDSPPLNTGDGPDLNSDYTLLRRTKRHDYFTSCLPFPQKGDPVTIPLGAQAPITGLGKGNVTFNLVDQDVLETDAPSTVTYPFASQIAGPGGANDDFFILGTGAAGGPQIYADLSDATAITINALRQGFQIQRLLERDARGGTRYTEIVRSHFGVFSPDQRLQRPEFLGGGSSPVIVSPVAQTSSTDATTPQANLSAIGTAALHNHGFTKSFTEHCVIIGLINVRADITYQQGLQRMWSRSTRFDFYWPALANIGEQAVLNKEIFTQGVAADELVFGYQERYAEYRYKPSQITGDFRSNAPGGSLDSWHLSQDFSTLPTLGNTFIEDNPPVDRVIAVTTEPHFLFDAYFSMRCARPMPLYGVPGLIDHF